MIFGMVMGFIWIISFIVAMNEFVIICSACSWYFSRKDIADGDGIAGDSDIWKGMWWSWRYHAGSLALGSLILSLFWLIRGLFEYIGEKVNKATGENSCTKCLLCCINCCLDCFDRFLRFLNLNAYIYMAISGEGFCKSALHAFLLILKNKAKFAFVKGIEGLFMFLAKFCIAIGTTLFCWFLIVVWTDQANDVTVHPINPSIFVFIFAYLIAAIFIGIFEVSSNSILQCYCMDVDIAKQN